jgi:tRNA-Thr(GGU) m(6)t(6)A37 methyltransferase TsaA
MIVIARIENGLEDKFGIPRQSGLVDSLKSVIVFEPEYRVAEAFRGLEGYSHIWLIWKFSEAVREEWSPTVRPPRLGGNTRMGVFATRSPYRPNPVGLSSVKLDRIELDSPDGPLLHISGADLMDGTPIYDIKPYLSYVDSHPEATGGFALQQKEGVIAVECPEELLKIVPENKRQALLDLLAQDPRPAYQNDPDRLYGMEYAGFEIKFKAEEKLLTVIKIAAM